MTGVIEPRLQFWPVLRRGLLIGAAAIVPMTAIALLVTDDQARLTFLAVVTGFAVIIGMLSAAFGLFYWWCAHGDIRRWRDWRTLRSRYEGVGIMAATFVRLLGMCLVIAPVGFVLTVLLR